LLGSKANRPFVAAMSRSAENGSADPGQILEAPMLNRFIAMSGALWYSLRYVGRLKIRLGELTRYLVKSFNLAICYSGFSLPNSRDQAFRAGKSAFLCCAYDVVTDWRRFDSFAHDAFKEILAKETTPCLANIALDLYAKDANGRLGEDGLERGSIAFRLVTRTIGTEDFFAESIDIDHAGRLWQLVDDLLDYEADVQAGSANCLDSSNRLLYLKRADSLLLDPFASTFLRDLVLAYVTRRAVEKARFMIAKYHPKIAS
jgi:hypothetical protein